MCFRKIYMVFLIAILQTNLAFSFEFEYTSHSIDMMAFFQDEMAEYIGILNDGQGVPFYTSVYLNEPNSFKDGFFTNATVGTFIRFNKYLLLPINTTMSWFNNLPISDLNFLFNSGLVFQSNIGTIGLFAGYNYSRYKVEGEYTYDSYSGIGGYSDSIEHTDGKVKFSMVPIINTAEFPIMGYALKSLEGYINADRDSEINYSITFVSRPLEIGSLIINNIKPYYSKKRFNLNAQINTYGLITNIDIPNKFVFFIDAGYKDYFDVIAMNDYYEDTPYLRFGFPIGYDWQYKNIWQGISLYLDKHFLIPKIGYIAQIRNSRLILEMGFYKYFEILIAYRFNWDDKKYRRW